MQCLFLVFCLNIDRVITRPRCTSRLTASTRSYQYYYNPCTPFTMGLCSNASVGRKAKYAPINKLYKYIYIADYRLFTRIIFTLDIHIMAQCGKIYVSCTPQGIRTPFPLYCDLLKFGTRVFKRQYTHWRFSSALNGGYKNMNEM